MKSFFIFCLFYSSFSFAKIHIEPYFGYSFTVIGYEDFSRQILSTNSIERIQQNISAIESASYYHGITPGMRLGYRSLNLAVGLDFTFGYWKSLGKQQNLFPVLPGLFASYKLPILFRVYGSLIPQAFVRVQAKDQHKTYNQSRGMKLGFSYLSLPFLSINIEWMPLFIGARENSGYWSHAGTVYGNITF